MGFGTGASSKANDVKAPMPGLIVGVMVDIGQAVKKGDTLVILEAMKMENAIKAGGDGVVKKVAVSTGDKVDKNQVLVAFA
jgi:biotin carboxyl carrier protein